MTLPDVETDYRSRPGPFLSFAESMHMVDFNKDTERPNLRFSRVMTRLWLSMSVEALLTKGTRNVALRAPLVDLAVKLETARQEIFRGCRPLI